jgi:hypothetical protein
LWFRFDPSNGMNGNWNCFPRANFVLELQPVLGQLHDITVVQDATSYTLAVNHYAVTAVQIDDDKSAVSGGRYHCMVAVQVLAGEL